MLRDVYVRGKYRDVILPMTVIRRLDALLEPTKDAVLGMKKTLDVAGIAAFITREVLPYTPDAWVDEAKTQIGYEISFTRHFYKPVAWRIISLRLATKQEIKIYAEA